MKTVLQILLIISVLVTVPQLTYAEESKHYMGFGLGMSNGEITAPIAISKDESSTAFKVFGGTELSPHFDLEVGYANFGEFTSKFTSGNEVDTFESSAIFASVLGKLSFNDDVYAFLRVGVHYWMTEFEADFDVAPYGSSASGSGFDVLYGLGLGFDVSDRHVVRLDVERYVKVADSIDITTTPGASYSLNSMDITVIGLVYAYNF